jgi:hypothetical protein
VYSGGPTRRFLPEVQDDALRRQIELAGTRSEGDLTALMQEGETGKTTEHAAMLVGIAQRYVYYAASRRASARFNAERVFGTNCSTARKVDTKPGYAKRWRSELIRADRGNLPPHKQIIGEPLVPVLPQLQPLGFQSRSQIRVCGTTVQRS